MNFRLPRQRLVLIAGTCLPVFLSACASTPQVVTASCPQFPLLPPELMQPPPTLYLLPGSQQPVPTAKN